LPPATGRLAGYQPAPTGLACRARTFSGSRGTEHDIPSLASRLTCELSASGLRCCQAYCRPPGLRRSHRIPRPKPKQRHGPQLTVGPPWAMRIRLIRSLATGCRAHCDRSASFVSRETGRGSTRSECRQDTPPRANGVRIAVGCAPGRRTLALLSQEQAHGGRPVRDRTTRLAYGPGSDCARAAYGDTNTAVAMVTRTAAPPLELDPGPAPSTRPQTMHDTGG
jgi:hypothetical protein